MKFLHWMVGVVLWAAVPVSAAELPEPEGRVLLTVSGAIAAENSAGSATFDRAMLENLDWKTIKTYTSFTEGQQTFSGPTLTSLLEVLGVEDGTLFASAINDYTVQIDVSDAHEHDVLLAMDHNGVPMRVRDKGPIWIVYPLTEEAAVAHPFDAEMIWQLARIRVD